MPKLLRELILAAAGVVFGVGLFFVSSLLAPPIEGPCVGCISFGIPFSGTTNTAPYGTAIGVEPQFVLALTFWIVVGVIIVEVIARVAALFWK